MKWSEFQNLTLMTDAGRLHARIGGYGKPLVLLHGFPQTHMMWQKVAPLLSHTHQVICVDLPGYGKSDPPADIKHASKRAMASVLVEALSSLGHEKFELAGHDRGGRVAYRLALDHPAVVSKLAVLDIMTTIDYWSKMDASLAMKIYHWTFLAQPAPLPETLISAASDHFLEHTLASWSGSRDLSCFSEEALQVYREQLQNPVNLRAMCDDYRAGQSLDADHDRADQGKAKITCPTLVLWGSTGIAANAGTPLDSWRSWCTDVQGRAIDSGHFMAEENPQSTAQALATFFN